MLQKPPKNDATAVNQRNPVSADNTEGTKEMLDDMHKRKIDMADEIYVINVDGYIGSSTRSEIEHAIATGKTVRYLEPLQGL